MRQNRRGKERKVKLSEHHDYGDGVMICRDRMILTRTEDEGDGHTGCKSATSNAVRHEVDVRVTERG